ncbi:F-type ATPase subunit b [Bacteroidales bacterium Barb7]|nr:F-type ATPase subunit b [Bacteroidales bacterium Barb7]
MELFTPELGLVVWMLVAFLAVFFLLAKFAWPAVIKGVEERKSFIDQSLESARDANERLAGIKQEGDQMLHEAHVEQLHRLKETKEKCNRLIQEAKEQAALEAGKIIAEAKVSVQKEKEMAVRDIHNQIAALSIDIAEKVLRKHLDNRPAQLELVNKLIEEAGQK